jgi:hypothetical protein
MIRILAIFLLASCGKIDGRITPLPRVPGPRPPGTQAPEFFRMDIPVFKEA